MDIINTTPCKRGTLFIIIGLPGSGKSFLIKTKFMGMLSKENIFDDYHKDSYNNSPEIEKSCNYSKLINRLMAGDDCVISDIEFCKTRHLNKLLDKLNSIVTSLNYELHCFRNQPEQCMKNVKHRNRENAKSEIIKIMELTKLYTPPQKSILYDVALAKDQIQECNKASGVKAE